MTIRKAKRSDLKAIEAWAEQSSQAFSYLRFDKQGTRAVAEQLLSSPQHYLKVVEKDGQLVAVLAAPSHDGDWFEKKHSSAIFWYSIEPGAGAALLRDYRDWVLSRPVLKFASFIPFHDWDSRINSLLERVGFRRSGGSYILTRF